MIVAVVNQKGGVGKTATCFHLAAAATARGLRTLVVDADSQANLTGVITAETLPADVASLADVLSPRTETPMQDVMVDGVWEGLDVVTSGGSTLRAVANEIFGLTTGREYRLKQALKPVAADYDVILIDCGPDIGMLTMNALVAADRALIVTQPASWATTAIAEMLQTIQDVTEHYNPALAPGPVLINHVDPRRVAAQTWLPTIHEICQARGVTTLDPVVPKAAVISDAAEAATSLTDWGGEKAHHIASIYDQHLTTICKETGHHGTP